MSFYYYRYGDQLKVGRDYWVVFGNEHSGKVVAYPRRIYLNGRYEKFNFQENYLELIKRHFYKYAGNFGYVNQYCADFFTVEKPQSGDYFFPEGGASQLVKSGKPAASDFCQLIEIIRRCGVKRQQIGLSGSFLVGLDNEHSDFDTLIYNKNQSELAVKLAEELIDRNLLLLDFSRLSPLTRKRFYRAYGREIKENPRRFAKAGRSIFEGKLHERRFTLVSGFPRVLTVKPKLQRPVKFVNGLQGEIVDDSQCMPRPSIYLVDCGLDKLVELISFSRAHCLYRNGDRIKLNGLLSEYVGGTMYRLSIIWPRDGSVATVKLNL